MYYVILKRLLPPGHFWEIKRGSSFDRLLSTLAKEFERSSNYASELMHDMEHFQIEVGNLSRPYIEKALADLGHSGFTIIDHTEEPLSVDTKAENKLGQVKLQLRWMPRHFQAGSRVGTHVLEWTNIELERDFKSLIPADITAKFDYIKEETNA